MKGNERRNVQKSVDTPALHLELSNRPSEDAGRNECVTLAFSVDTQYSGRAREQIYRRSSNAIIIVNEIICHYL